MANIVVVKQSGNVLSSQKVTLKNIPTVSTNTTPTSFDNLKDVDASQETDGSVPQFDLETGKYVVKPLILDGGEF